MSLRMHLGDTSLSFIVVIQSDSIGRHCTIVIERKVSTCRQLNVIRAQQAIWTRLLVLPSRSRNNSADTLTSGRVAL